MDSNIISVISIKSTNSINGSINFTSNCCVNDDRNYKAKGVKIMKNLKKAMLEIVAKVAKDTAEKSCNNASFFYCYQPKEPAALRKISKK